MTFQADFEAQLTLALWVTEAARSSVLGLRGRHAGSVRVAGRARILGTRCAELGVGVQPGWAGEHARWMGQVSGTQEETGALGGFFLQRMGAYVDLHSESVLPKGYWARLVELGVPDSKEVEEALSRDGIPPPPPPDWPTLETAVPPGAVHTRFGVIGDPHAGSKWGDRFLPSVIEEVNAQHVDFSVAIGDLTQSAREEQFRKVHAHLARLTSPWFVTLGNHDMWGGDRDNPVGMERYRQVFDQIPHGEFGNDRVRLIIVNSADPRQSPFPPFDLLTGTFTNDPKEAIPGGRISGEVAAWAAGLQPDGRPTFVVLHHPPYPYLGFPALAFGLDRDSTKVLEDLVIRTRAWGVICGHTHRSALSELAGVPVIEVPSPKEWPYGYGVVDVTERGWAFNLHPAGEEALVREASFSANAVIRRYARGPDQARAFATDVPQEQLAAPQGP